MKRSAFTLVELLVVIGVIAILLGILIPGVSAAREHARRTQCIAKQRDLAIAMATHDRESNGLPGYLNQLGETPMRSWVVPLLPLIGESKRYEYMMEIPPRENTPEFPPYARRVIEATVPLLALLCPSDNPREACRLNYVVNCGPATEHFAIASVTNGGDIAPHFSPFKDRRRILAPPLPPVDLTTINKKVKIEDIPDGASNTILLTENVSNVELNVWHLGIPTPPNELLTSAVPPVPTRDSAAVLHLGFTWVPNWSTAALQTAYAPNSTARGPRPSSRHPGTIVAAFADGSARVINNSVSPTAWFQFVCPDDEKAEKMFSTGGLRQ